MTRPIQPPPPEFTTPPGTVRMVREDGRFETSELVLQPTPSSDPNDPLNWSRGRKLANFVPALAITAIIFTQTSLPILFWVLWIPEFGWTYGQLNAASAVNYVGTAVGCILFIPPAVKYGRRSMYILSTTIILAMAVWSACLSSLPELFVSQLLFGLANATNETIVEMTVIRARLSFLSQIIAGYMSADGNWRLCYWVLFAFEAALLIYFCLFFEETKYIPCIEARRLETAKVSQASSSKKDAGSAFESQEAEQGSPIMPQVSQAGTHRIGPSIPLLTWRQRMRLVTKTDQSLLSIAWQSVVIMYRFPAVMYTALTYAFTVGWITAQASLISIVFTQPPYNFGTVGVGNMNLGIFVGCILGSIYAALSDKAVVWFARRNYGYYEPEMRLQLNHLPALCLGGGFIMFGVTATKVTGEAFIGVAFIRNCFSIAISFATVPWLDAQGLQNMCIAMGVLATVTGFLHIPLLMWGKKIRERTAESYEKLVKEREGSHL
ncbi:hypothetical protein Neosp_009128 [[Neocosmospora] mangrovei]